jgi:hypothetical protein
MEWKKHVFSTFLHLSFLTLHKYMSLNTERTYDVDWPSNCFSSIIIIKKWEGENTHIPNFLAEEVLFLAKEISV